MNTKTSIIGGSAIVAAVAIVGACTLNQPVAPSQLPATVAAQTPVQPFQIPGMTVEAQPSVNASQYAKYEPDPVLSPGVVDPSLTLAVLQAPGFTTKKYRNVTEAEKKAVFAEYVAIGRVPSNYVAGGWEIDHIVSLEAGGSNDIRNLWPQPYAEPYGAHTKDKLEDLMNRQIKAGKIGLAQAQFNLSHDWVAQYLAYQKQGLIK